MTYEEMKDSHEAQIEALLANDFEAFTNVFGGEVREGIDTHHMAWGQSGEAIESLFSYLPNCSCCLTQAKDELINRRSGSCTYEGVIAWDQKLGIATNDLIPNHIAPRTVLTREQLEEFSRLQLLANFPEELRP